MIEETVPTSFKAATLFLVVAFLVSLSKLSLCEAQRSTIVCAGSREWLNFSVPAYSPFVKPPDRCPIDKLALTLFPQARALIWRSFAASCTSEDLAEALLSDAIAAGTCTADDVLFSTSLSLGTGLNRQLFRLPLLGSFPRLHSATGEQESAESTLAHRLTSPISLRATQLGARAGGLAQGAAALLDRYEQKKEQEPSNAFVSAVDKLSELFQGAGTNHPRRVEAKAEEAPIEHADAEAGAAAAAPAASASMLPQTQTSSPSLALTDLPPSAHREPKTMNLGNIEDMPPLMTNLLGTGFAAAMTLMNSRSLSAIELQKNDLDVCAGLLGTSAVGEAAECVILGPIDGKREVHLSTVVRAVNSLIASSGSGSGNGGRAQKGTVVVVNLQPYGLDETEVDVETREVLRHLVRTLAETFLVATVDGNRSCFIADSAGGSSLCVGPWVTNGTVALQGLEVSRSTPLLRSLQAVFSSSELGTPSGTKLGNSAAAPLPTSGGGTANELELALPPSTNSKGVACSIPGLLADGEQAATATKQQSIEDCQRACKALQGCELFTFDAELFTCRLLRTVTATAASATAISGPPVCPSDFSTAGDAGAPTRGVADGGALFGAGLSGDGGGLFRSTEQVAQSAVEGMAMVPAGGLIPAASTLLQTSNRLFQLFPITDLARAGYQLYNTGFFRNRAVRGMAGNAKKDAIAPPVGVGSPKVSCLSEGMRCCVPREAADRWNNNPPYLNSEKTARCTAQYVSASDELCVTTKYIGDTCGTMVTETTAQVAYRNIMTMPARGMNNAICECAERKDPNDASAGRSVVGSASWEYSLVAMSETAEQREAAKETAGKLAQGAATALQLTQALVGGNGAIESEGADSGGGGGGDGGGGVGVLSGLEGLGNQGGETLGGGGDATGGDGTLLNAAQTIGNLVGMMANNRQMRAPVSGGANLRRLAERGKEAGGEEEVKGKGEGGDEDGGGKNQCSEGQIVGFWPENCKAWRTQCESSFADFVFSSDCAPISLVTNGCPEAGMAVDLVGTETTRLQLDFLRSQKTLTSLSRNERQKGDRRVDAETDEQGSRESEGGVQQGDWRETPFSVTCTFRSVKCEDRDRLTNSCEGEQNRSQGQGGGHTIKTTKEGGGLKENGDDASIVDGRGGASVRREDDWDKWVPITLVRGVLALLSNLTEAAASGNGKVPSIEKLVGGMVESLGSLAPREGV